MVPFPFLEFLIVHSVTRDCRKRSLVENCFARPRISSKYFASTTLSYSRKVPSTGSRVPALPITRRTRGRSKVSGGATCPACSTTEVELSILWALTAPAPMKFKSGQAALGAISGDVWLGFQRLRMENNSWPDWTQIIVHGHGPRREDGLAGIVHTLPWLPCPARCSYLWKATTLSGSTWDHLAGSGFTSVAAGDALNVWAVGPEVGGDDAAA